MAWGISSIDDLLRFESLSPIIFASYLLCMLGGNGNGNDLSFQVLDRFSFSCNFCVCMLSLST